MLPTLSNERFRQTWTEGCLVSRRETLSSNSQGRAIVVHCDGIGRSRKSQATCAHLMHQLRGLDERS
jgi:hypothetical protein